MQGSRPDRADDDTDAFAAVFGLWLASASKSASWATGRSINSC